MTTKADFTEEEWATVVRSPIVAGMAITLADPGGPIEVVKETSAVLKFVTGGGEERDDLVGEVTREIRSLAQQRTNPVGDFKPRGALAGKEVVDEITRAGEIVSAKATPEETEAFPRGSWSARSAPRTPPRRAASWASTPSASARARRTCSPSSARRWAALARTLSAATVWGRAHRDLERQLAQAAHAAVPAVAGRAQAGRGLPPGDEARRRRAGRAARRRARGARLRGRGPR